MRISFIQYMKLVKCQINDGENGYLMACIPLQSTDVYQNPFHARHLPNGGLLAVSASGDFAILKDDELAALFSDPRQLPPEKLAELRPNLW